MRIIKVLSPLLLVGLLLITKAGFAANDAGWMKTSTVKGIEVPAPGIKLTGNASAPSHSDLADGVVYYNSGDGNLYLRSGGAWVDLTVQGGGSTTLDQAFDNGKIINGANSLANAVQLGDGTDALLIHTEAAGDVRITTNGTSDLTIAPDGGDTDITGTLDVSGAVGIDGNFDINTDKFTVNATTGAAAIGGALNVTGATTLNAATSITAGGLAVTGGLNTDTLNISSGGLTLSGDILQTAATTTGNGYYLDGGTVTTGDAFQIEYDATEMNGGNIFHITEDGATVFKIAEDGNTTIQGTAAGTTALQVLTGNIAIGNGRFGVTRNSSSDNVITANRGANATGGSGVLVNMGTAAVGGHGVSVTFDGAGTGNGLDANMTNNLAGNALNVTGAGVRTAPLINLASNGTDGGTDDNVIRAIQDGLLDSDMVFLGYTTAASTGNALGIDMNTNLAGNGIYVDHGATARTGAALKVKDDSTAAHSDIDLDLSGSGAATGIDIQGSYNGSPAGDAIKVTLDDADNLDTGIMNITVGTGNRGALIKYASTGTDSGTTSHVIDINQTGVLDSNILDITYDTGASTGKAVNLVMGTNVAGTALSIDTEATGADNTGAGIDIQADGALVQGANLVRIDSAGNMAHADCRIMEINETGADQANSYVATIASTNNGALTLSAAAADDALLISQGLLNLGANKAQFFDSAVGMYSQADTFLDVYADGGLRIGDSSAGAPTNYAKFASDGGLTFTGTSRRTKKLWIGSESFKNQTSASEGVVAAGYKHSWEFTDGAAESVTTSFMVPDNWASGTDITVYVHWSTPATTQTGRWSGAYVPVVAGEDPTAAGTALTAEDDVSSGTADYLNVTNGFTIANANVAAGDQVILVITREGNHANDTLADIADLHGVTISYTANTY